MARKPRNLRPGSTRSAMGDMMTRIHRLRGVRAFGDRASKLGTLAAFTCLAVLTCAAPVHAQNPERSERNTKSHSSADFSVERGGVNRFEERQPQEGRQRDEREIAPLIFRSPFGGRVIVNPEPEELLGIPGANVVVPALGPAAPKSQPSTTPATPAEEWEAIPQRASGPRSTVVYSLTDLVLEIAEQTAVPREAARTALVKILDERAPALLGGKWHGESVVFSGDSVQHQQVVEQLERIRGEGFDALQVDLWIGLVESSALDQLPIQWQAIPDPDSRDLAQQLEASGSAERDPERTGIAEFPAAGYRPFARATVERTQVARLATLDGEQRAGLLKRLQQSPSTKLLGSPSVIVFSGHSASVLSGGERRFVVDVQAGQPVTRTIFEGLSAKVRPHLSDNLVRLEAVIELSQVQASEAAGLQGDAPAEVQVQTPLVERQRIELAGDLRLGGSLLLRGVPTRTADGRVVEQVTIAHVLRAREPGDSPVGQAHAAGRDSIDVGLLPLVEPSPADPLTPPLPRLVPPQFAPADLPAAAPVHSPAPPSESEEEVPASSVWERLRRFISGSPVGQTHPSDAYLQDDVQFFPIDVPSATPPLAP